MLSTQDRIRKILMNSGMATLPDSTTVGLVDYGLDSIMVVIVALALEKEFSVKVPGEDVDPGEMATIEKIASLVRRLQKVPRE